MCSIIKKSPKAQKISCAHTEPPRSGSVNAQIATEFVAKCSQRLFRPRRQKRYVPSKKCATCSASCWLYEFSRMPGLYRLQLSRRNPQKKMQYVTIPLPYCCIGQYIIIYMEPMPSTTNLLIFTHSQHFLSLVPQT